MTTLVALIFAAAAACVLQVVAIWLSAWAARIPNVSFSRAAGTWGVQMLLWFIVSMLAISTYFVRSNYLPDRLSWLPLTLYSVASIATWFAAAKMVLRGNWVQTIVVYMAQSAVVAVALIALRLLVLEWFIVPTGAMAPTVVGHRYLGECPACGGHVLITARDEPTFLSSEPAPGICGDCWQPQEVQPDFTQRFQGDRILVSKLESFRRFDVVTYRPPPAPGQIYIHRLIGLPGEHLEIRGGSVWIDGRELEMPSELSRVKYFADWSSNADAIADWQLADDEYFVIGDNTTLSMDSREFGPVPAKDMLAVAVATYWPPPRARLLRQPGERSRE
jgi:signal peptidase I